MSEYAPIKSNICTFSTVADTASSTTILAENLRRNHAGAHQPGHRHSAHG